MTKIIQAIRGMNDIPPAQTSYWQYLEEILRNIAKNYGYQEIRFPLVEQTALFQRTIGEVTDIVEKEMYTFTDKSGDSLTLRPEGTAGCVRAGIQQALLYNQTQRLWYMGPMFRHERPQKGRYRQFHQFGVEVFGLQGPDIDAELILMMACLWNILGVSNKVTLRLSNLGTKEVRARYREDLITFFTQYFSILDEDSRRRLHTNPLRILDSKNPHTQELISNAPNFLDYLDVSSAQHFQDLQNILDSAQIKYVIDPRLVRGLDYYGLTVFEWVTESQGAQNTICGGGRYDDLVGQLGGKPTPAVGFALGLERLVELISAEKIIENHPLVYLVTVGKKAESYGLTLAEKIRAALPNLSLLTNCGGGDFKTQFKRADKSGARFALVLGEEEILKGVITLKYLREDKPQQTLALEEIIEMWQ